MSKYQFGDGVILNVGIETTRGEASGSMKSIIGAEPTSFQDKVEKVVRTATRNNRVMNAGSRLLQQYGEGGIVKDVMIETCLPFLYSLAGKYAVEELETGVFKHTFTPEPHKALHPTLTVEVMEEFMQSYRFLNAHVASGEFVVDTESNVKSTYEFVGKKGAGIDYVAPTFSTTDHDFVHHETFIDLKDFGVAFTNENTVEAKKATISISNNGRRDTVIGNLGLNEVIGNKHEATVALEINKLNDDQRDDFVNNTAKSIKVSMVRNDVTIGATNKPTVSLIIPYMTPSNREEVRPNDDTLSETLNYEAGVEYSGTNVLYQVEVINTIPSLIA